MQNFDGFHGTRLTCILRITTIFVWQQIHVDKIAEARENIIQNFRRKCLQLEIRERTIYQHGLLFEVYRKKYGLLPLARKR